MFSFNSSIQCNYALKVKENNHTTVGPFLCHASFSHCRNRFSCEIFRGRVRLQQKYDWAHSFMTLMKEVFQPGASKFCIYETIQDLQR